MLTQLRRNFSYGCRQLRKDPAFTIVVLVLLALGIGVNTAVFSVADPLMLRPLPARNPQDLVLFQALDPDQPGSWSDLVTYDLFARIRDENRSFSNVFVTLVHQRVTMTEGGEESGEPLWMTPVSGAYFTTLGVEAAAGRIFTEIDDRPEASPVAVISHRLWRRRFGADLQAIGTQITLDNGFGAGALLPGGLRDVSFTIVGVMPRNFHGVDVDGQPDVWIPLHVYAAANPGVTNLLQSTPGGLGGRIMARLRPGANLEMAQAEVDVIQQRIAAAASGSPLERFITRPIRVEPGGRGFSQLRAQFQRPMLVLLSAAGIVLLIACANIAALVLARNAARRTEIAVRLAVGGPRSAVVAQLLTEGLILSFIGGGLALAVAYAGAQLLLGYLPPDSGFVPRAGLDLRVLGFTGGLSVLSVLGFGLAPALRTSNVDLNSLLRGSRQNLSQPRVSLNRLIAILQIAFSLVLLVGAGLFLGTLQNLRQVDPGFDQENVLQFSIEMNPSGLNPGWSDFVTRLLMRLEAIPGVQAATHYSGWGLLSGNERFASIDADGSFPDSSPNAAILPAGPRFFETLGIPLLLGRTFRADDLEADPLTILMNPPVLISRNMARGLFGDQIPVGARIRMDGAEVQILGVVEDVRYGSLREPPPWTMYPLFLEIFPTGSRFAVRTDGDAAAVIPAIEDAVRETGGGFRVVNLQSMREVVESTFARERFLLHLTGLFALLSLLLAAVGVYGIFSYHVRQQSGDLAVRMALGAQANDVMRLLGRELLFILTVGCLAGLLAAWGLTRWISSLLFGLSPTDPWTLSAATTLLIVTAILAGYFPARRAARTDPANALRLE